MPQLEPLDLHVSVEGEIEVDDETAAAIDKGIRAADEGLVVSSDEARKKLLAR